MDEIDQIKAQMETMRTALLRIRADLFAYGIVMDASFIAMTPNARAALRHNLTTLSEQAIAAGLATSRSEDDSSIHALQDAVHRVMERLDKLPHS